MPTRARPEPQPGSDQRRVQPPGGARFEVQGAESAAEGHTTARNRPCWKGIGEFVRQQVKEVSVAPGGPAGPANLRLRVRARA